MFSEVVPGFLYCDAFLVLNQIWCKVMLIWSGGGGVVSVVAFYCCVQSVPDNSQGLETNLLSLGLCLLRC